MHLPDRIVVMRFCCLCGMARTAEPASHLCTFEVVGLLNSQTASA